MPLPIADCVDDIPAETCCTVLFDVADRVRHIATTAVENCFVEQCSHLPWRSYVTVGSSPEDYHGDCLVVQMTGIRPSSQSTTSTKTLGVVVFEADYRVQLWETGWPTMETIYNGEGDVINIILPDSEIVNAVARHAYAHGESMYRALADAVAKRTLLTPVAGNFGHAQISALEPTNPSGGLAGWSTTIRVQIQFPPGGWAS